MTGILRVALGPSLSQWRDRLQGQLGQGWLVTDLMSQARSSLPAHVNVLGTTEIPPESIEVVGRSIPACVLVGTLRSSPGAITGRAAGDAELVRRLAGQLRALAAPSPSPASAGAEPVPVAFPAKHLAPRVVLATR
jgi:hypothetical protein